jgi:hypothetical protein
MTPPFLPLPLFSLVLSPTFGSPPPPPVTNEREQNDLSSLSEERCVYDSAGQDERPDQSWQGCGGSSFFLKFCLTDTAMEFLDREEQNLALKPPKGSERERDNFYYEILAGGAKMR